MGAYILDGLVWWAAAIVIFVALWAMPRVVYEREAEGYGYLAFLIIVAVILVVAAWTLRP